MGMQLQDLEIMCSWKGGCSDISTNASPGQQKRDSTLKTIGHVTAKVMWPMERRGQCTGAGPEQ